MQVQKRARKSKYRSLLPARYSLFFSSMYLESVKCLNYGLRFVKGKALASSEGTHSSLTKPYIFFSMCLVIEKISRISLFLLLLLTVKS
ncbi:hypothetical protein ES332_A08G090100v1 [Gossypium tomentosum]|uniref:Uncharacterized protein n=1 Tax=Gossypium tomentosum TaxID=34277 RepID=A0A5D2PCB9_GOSTO|nr:hypothetical protein ES332_A08G090100v1 [Gossypium tomentosum]